MLMPKMGKELIIMGSMAQCMAQANDVAIPNASQFTFIFIALKNKDTIFAMLLQFISFC